MAIALFGGFYFDDKRLSYLIPLAIMFISDLFLGLHSSMVTVYLSVMIGVYVGSRAKNNNPLRIAGASLLNSVIFFLLTNFSVWLFDGIYTLNLVGLTDCYVMAIPFFRNAVIGDLVYTTALFGIYSLAGKFVPKFSLN